MFKIKITIASLKCTGVLTLTAPEMLLGARCLISQFDLRWGRANTKILAANVKYILGLPNITGCIIAFFGNDPLSCRRDERFPGRVNYTVPITCLR